MFEVTATVPAVTLMAPENVFVPERVSVPVPCFVIPPVPDPLSLLITPENVVEVLSPPTVNWVLCSISIVPAPAIDPTVSSLLVSNNAPDATVNAVVFGNEPVKFKVPPLTVVLPVKEFVPARTKVPLSSLITPPVLAIGSETVIVLLAVSKVKSPVPVKEFPELTLNVISSELAAIVAFPSRVIRPE